jgi:hypothetical protein
VASRRIPNDVRGDVGASEAPARPDVRLGDENEHVGMPRMYKVWTICWLRMTTNASVIVQVSV